MKRIEHLREAALCGGICYNEFFYRFYRAHGGEAACVTYESYAEAYMAAMDGMRPTIDANELIVGHAVDRMTESERQEWRTVYEPIAHRYMKDKRQNNENSHMAIDYESVLSEGLLGIVARIDGYLASCEEQKKPFYRACRACCLAVIRHAEHYADEAERQASETDDGARREELTEIARICRRVPTHAAESFYEAVQSVHFITYAVSMDPMFCFDQQFQLGHPDRYLWRFYQADIERGVLTRERAQLLLDCLGIQINRRVISGLSSGYMVGGRDENGKVVANELTEMCMRVIDDIRLVYPSVGLCYTPDMPARYLEIACEILSHGRSHPAIFNDDVIAAGLQSYGVPLKDSHDYIHSTCVEITPTGASNVWVACPYTNMAQLLLDTMKDEHNSYAALYAALVTRLDGIIKENFERYDGFRRYRAERGDMNPLLSCLVHDCLERGLDIEQGGARYNWIMPSFVGMANLVDSLYAVKHVVYDTCELTLCELRDILDRNFEGNEALRLRLLGELPKYGNDIDEIDGMFGRLTDHIVAECKKYTPCLGGARLVPSVFCWVMHERFGRTTGATPDGRPAGFPLGDGSGPCQGREMKGPTASILSSTKWDHHEMIGGVAVNMKFSKASLGASSLDTMASLIRVFMERGGFELQINVVDRALLEKAREHPEQYRDLVVRIGGYSDYFTRLSPEMQAEVILRTAHRI